MNLSPNFNKDLKQIAKNHRRAFSRGGFFLGQDNNLQE